MSLLFQHGNEKNAYDPYMGHTYGKELITMCCSVEAYVVVVVL